MQKELNKFKEEQIRLAKKIVVKDDFDEINLVAGVDQAFLDKDIISAVVVFDYKTMKVVEKAYAVVRANIPYIPGFLGFREGHAVIEAFNKLNKRPDVLMIDAHGIIHPRKIGMASHVGLLLDVPTIGIAKTLLCGESREGKVYVDEEVRGKEVITRKHANPIYVSPGHRVCLKTAVEIVNNSIVNPHKYPEPLHLAHRYAKDLMKEI